MNITKIRSRVENEIAEEKKVSFSRRGNTCYLDTDTEAKAKEKVSRD